MKILLVNNHTVHMSKLGLALAGHEVEVQMYRPGVEFNDAGKDLVILSGGGGEGLEIDDEYQPGKLWYDDEMKFIHDTQKPVIGICMGFEVIAKAFGAPVTSAGGLILGRERVQLDKRAGAVFGTDGLHQYEAHSWRVEDVPSGFEVLATSKTGIEIFRYEDKQKPGKTIFATQFHPEKGGTLELRQLIAGTI